MTKVEAETGKMVAALRDGLELRALKLKQAQDAPVRR